MQTMQPIRCAVMVDVKPVQIAFTQMCDVIRGLALGAGLNPEEVEEDSIKTLLDQCVNHYLEYILSHSQGNLGFNYYIEEYFKRFAPFILSRPDAMQFLGAQFAIITAQVANNLQPAVAALGNGGQHVEHINSHLIQPGKLSMYLVEGTTWEEE